MHLLHTWHKLRFGNNIASSSAAKCGQICVLHLLSPSFLSVDKCRCATRESSLSVHGIQTLGNYSKKQNPCEYKHGLPVGLEMTRNCCSRTAFAGAEGKEGLERMNSR